MTTGKYRNYTLSTFLSILILLSFSCTQEINDKATIENPFSGPSPWPEIRKERIQKLLPEAMKTAGTDAWIVLCRENNNDPIAHHIGGENAGGQALFLFYLEGENVKSVVFCPIGEATALADLKIHDEVIPVQRGNSAIADASEYIRTKQFQKIAAVANKCPTHKLKIEGYTDCMKSISPEQVVEKIQQLLTHHQSQH